MTAKAREKSASVPAQLGSPAARPAFRRRLLTWYDRNRRDLPWRGSRDPYRIWVSEVMLQQTRVAAVVAYYQRFLQQFPDIKTLAAASEPAVLAAWSGLGYYRRARALYAAARSVVAERGGELPRTAAALRQLPGFGRYTAAAVSSIAFGEPVAVVDGNVERVLSRIFAWRKPKRHAAWQEAQQLLDPRRPGDFNQAMMELGATVCLPGEAQCTLCPLFRWCNTRGRGQPAKPERRRAGRLHYRLAERDGAVWLVQRSRCASLMPAMWELPEAASNGAQPDPSLAVRHSITVTDYKVEVSRGEPLSGRRGRWVTRAQVEALPLTGLTRKILRRASFI